jgi:carnitine O-acetyltransferase
MTARSFTKPTSLDQKLSLVLDSRNMSEPNGKPEGTRSNQAAKDSTDSYPQHERNPLASHKNGHSRPGITYAAQDNLPQLPIPDLESSCKKYLESLRPLQTPKEQHDSQASIKEFLRTDGPILQAKLKEYAHGKANYIEQFCEPNLSLVFRPTYANLVRVRLIS